MAYSKRAFLSGSAATAVSAMAVPTSALAASKPVDAVTSNEIRGLLAALPGITAFKVWAPATEGKPAFLAGSRSASRQLFVGSAIKTFVLCEALRQVDGPDVVQAMSQKQVPLDASVWSVDSRSFNPPNLTGLVSERTALEAMIMHSDNTATDMCLKLVGPDKVRAFIVSAGLSHTLIPDSTRVFFGYLLGVPDYKTFTWDELIAADDKPIVNPPLNQQETLASSADDFVSYYARALQGEFFKHPETLNEFRRILTLGDAISLLPFPLGVSAFVKGGSIDVKGFHCVCIPGGMFFANRWVYFCFNINWNAPAETDPDTVQAFIVAVRAAVNRIVNSLSS